MRTKWRRWLPAMAVAIAAVSSGACKETLNFDMSGPTPTATTATVAIRSSGFDPRFTYLRPGGTLTFDNQDGIAHRTSSDTCSQLNTSIAAGARVSIRMPSTAMTCTYHDEATPNLGGSVQLCSEIEGLLGPCR